ncbi:MAG: hypothetical protein ACFFDT_16310 [Candidatus Hodarchaeota archaeon]
MKIISEKKNFTSEFVIKVGPPLDLAVIRQVATQRGKFQFKDANVNVSGPQGPIHGKGLQILPKGTPGNILFMPQFPVPVPVPPPSIIVASNDQWVATDLIRDAWGLIEEALGYPAEFTLQVRVKCMIQFFVRGNPQQALQKAVSSRVRTSLEKNWETANIFGITFYRGEIGKIWHKITVEPLAASPKNRFHTLTQAFLSDVDSTILFLENIEKEIQFLLSVLLEKSTEEV